MLCYKLYFKDPLPNIKIYLLSKYRVVKEDEYMHLNHDLENKRHAMALSMQYVSVFKLWKVIVC